MMAKLGVIFQPEFRVKAVLARERFFPTQGRSNRVLDGKRKGEGQNFINIGHSL